MDGKSTSGRRRSVAVLVALPLLAAPAGWRPDMNAARAYARHRPGRIAFAVQTEQRAWSWHGDAVFPSASVLKAMLLVAYLREPYVRRRPLRGPERALLSPMIRRSDNDAATTIRDRIGNGALVRLAHAAGMQRFRPAAI